MEFEVKVGAFVEHIANRTYRISAETPEKAFQKACARFYRDQMRCARNTEVHSIQLDSMTLIEDGKHLDVTDSCRGMKQSW